MLKRLIPLALLCAAARAQGPANADLHGPADLHYEVVSIHQAPPPHGELISMRFSIDPHSSHADVQNGSYGVLLTFAFGIEGFQIDDKSKLPFALYDMRMSAGDDAEVQLKRMSDDDAKAVQQRMLQEVLAARFHLQYHWETREMPSYIMTAGKQTKMHPSAVKPGPDGKPRPEVENDPTTRWTDWKYSGQGWSVKARGVDMDWLAKAASGQLDAPVVDRTGLAGLWDFSFSWSLPFQSHDTAAASGTDQDLFPPFQAALAEQLGLKFERGKAPLKMLVIDHIEPPTPN